jgi:heme/copper-type cytochrome/quinol oxidase subunit 4
MVPTLSGRIQTRIFLLALIGWPLTMLITPMLPLAGPLSERYRTTLVVLAAVAVLGVAWEMLYHLLMQWRWEKDWPTLFGLVTLLPEGALIWLLGRRGLLPGLPGPLGFTGFAVHFVLVWLAIWLVANGPMRVLYFRWRFRGGRLL